MGKWVVEDVPPAWRDIPHPRAEGKVMPFSEDGYPVGSIDVSELDSVEPKSDEAKEALERLKAEVKLGQEQVAADEERLAEGDKAPGAETSQDTRDEQGKPEDAKPAEQPQQDQSGQVEAQKAAARRRGERG